MNEISKIYNVLKSKESLMDACDFKTEKYFAYGEQEGATAQFKLGFDKKGLYIFVKVLDDTPEYDSELSWENDSVEIFVDEKNIKLSEPDENCYFFRITRSGQVVNGEMPGNNFEISAEVQEFGDYYTISTYIPFKNELESEVTLMGFDLIVNDRRNGKRRSMSALSDAECLSFQNSEKYSTLAVGIPESPKMIMNDSMVLDLLNKDGKLFIDFDSFINKSKFARVLEEEGRRYVELSRSRLYIDGETFSIDEEKLDVEAMTVDGKLYASTDIIEKIGAKFVYEEEIKIAYAYVRADVFSSPYSLKGKICNFLGDSITWGVGATTPEDVYHAVFAKKNNVGLVRNYGISGTRVADCYDENGVLDDKFGSSFVARFEFMDDDADIICVFGGTNDYGHGTPDFGTMESRDRTSFYGALHYLASGLIEKYPDKFIMFMTPLHRTDENLPGPAGRPLIDYSRAIKEVCEYYSIPVLDLYANAGIYCDSAKHRKQWATDGLHPNDNGYEKIASLLTGFLKNYFPEN